MIPMNGKDGLERSRIWERKVWAKGHVLTGGSWGRTAALLGLLALPACSKPEPAAPPPAAAEEPAPAAEEELSADEAEALRAIEESAAAGDAEASTEAPSSDAQRNITYRVSPDGLRVQLEGVTFTPSAKAVRVGGGWGLELTVDAESSGTRSLASPTRGPLAFGGKVLRRGSDVETFGDERKGDGDLLVAPGEPVKFSRKWPGEGQKALTGQDELELHVGLWGFGATPEDRRPVRRFVVVKFKPGTTGSAPQIEPPPQ